MSHQLYNNKKPPSLIILFMTSAVISLIYTAITYSPGFISGEGSFWEMQIHDVGTYITGARYFIRDEWRFPLFYTKSLQFPDGANIIFTDSMPLMAFVAKIIYKLTGYEWNYFGNWFVISNILFGMSIVFLLDSLKTKSLLITIIFLLFGFSIFPYLRRTFHIALSSHFLLIFAISLYFQLLDPDRKTNKNLTAFLLLLIVCLLIHFYLFVMSFSIAIAAVLTMYIRKRLSKKQLLKYTAITGFVIAFVMICSGYISFDGSQNYKPVTNSGIASMNLLSPVLPINSLFFPAPPFKDPTGSQFFEGANYLGLPVLLILLFVLIRYPGEIKRLIFKHPVLTVLCTVFFIYSFSYTIYFGPHLVLDLSNIPGFYTLYGVLKATGRFFWINVYLITFLPLLLLYKKSKHPKLALVVLLALAVLQNAEIWPLRQKVYSRTRVAKKSEHYSFQNFAVKKHDIVLVGYNKARRFPIREYQEHVRSLYYIAGREGKKINYCYTARIPLNIVDSAELMTRYLNSDIPVLFVIPENSDYTKLVRNLSFKVELDGILYVSNCHNLTNLPKKGSYKIP